MSNNNHKHFSALDVGKQKKHAHIIDIGRTFYFWQSDANWIADMQRRAGIRKWIYLNSVRMKGEEKLQVSYFFFLCCIEEEAFGDASLVQRTRQIVLKREWRSAWPAVENGARQMVARENKNECNYHTCWTTLQSPFGFRNIKRNIKQNKKEEGSIKLKSSR